MKDAAQNAESAPAEPNDFSEYLSLKTQKPSDASEAQSPKEEEHAPASEPDENQDPKKELTDAEKSARKQANDKRREQRWFEERGKMKAEKERLERELADLKAAGQKTDSATVTAKSGEKPTLKAFLDSGKYQTYDDAQEAFLEARDEWTRKSIKAELEQEQSVSKQKTEAQTVRKTFNDNIKEFTKEHDGFDDAYEVVAERLDGDARFLSDALVRSGNIALIYHLGQNEELIDSLVDLPHTVALVELGKIAASLKPSGAPETSKTANPPPKPPRSVSARHNPPSREGALKAAAEADDFTAFRAASRKQG